jgi:hypothetical protein
MKLIKSIHIRGFRSIHDQQLAELGNLTVIVGKNSSGKSNLLRAMNLFFNGEPQAGSALSFSRDVHERPRRRQKKLISVSIEFVLPPDIKIRKQLTALASAGRSLRVTRTWELNQRREVVSSFQVFASDKRLSASDEVARQLLSIISFRYIPNRTIPADLLRDESQAIADAIFLRMKGDKHAAAVLEGLGAAAKRMMGEAKDGMKDSGAPMAEPTLSLAGTMGEMLRMTGFQATGHHGLPVRDEEWGAGHQAFFLYSLLQTLDTDYGRFFGWRQATIWGVEEPESGLHHDLATQLAGKMRDWAGAQKKRLQLLVTTHSPVFAMAADGGYWARLDGPESKFEYSDVQNLVVAAEEKGVCSWTHPALSFPWSVVVLVEGRIDEQILNRAAALIEAPRLKFVSLPSIDQEERAGGIDAIGTYLRRYGAIVRNRPARSPLLVLVDWDVSDQDVVKLRTAYGPNADRYVTRMKPGYTNPNLGQDFRGIERFYSTGAVQAAVAKGELVAAQDAAGVYSVSKSKLDDAKQRLMNRMLASKDPRDFDYLVHVIRDLPSSA